MAGTVDSKEIIVGAASLFINDTADTVGTSASRPALVSGTSYRDTLNADANWRNVGYTMEGLEVAYEPDYGDVEVDQILDSAFLFKQSQKVSINTTFAQATLLNLLVAWGQNPATFTSSAASLDIDGGALGDAPIERAFVAVGNGPRSINASNKQNVFSERVYHAYRILQVEQTTLGAKRGEASGIPVSFRALPANNGKYGTIFDRPRTW